MIVQEVSLSLIEEDKDQPRYNFDEEGLQQLVKSIEEIGLLNPIKVRILEDNRYKIIFGNRRYKAFQMLGYEKIPCIISELNNEIEIYLEQLAENIQREDFNPIEEADAFNKLLNGEFRASLKFLSTKLGKSEPYIRTKLDLLVFGQRVKELIKSGKETAPNKLTEDQLIPLKNISIEYRDSLAIKIAKEQVPPKDVKRIATLFTATDIKKDTKELLIAKTGDELLRTWSIYEEEKRQPIKPIDKPKLVPHEQNSVDELQSFEITPIETKLQDLISRIPVCKPLSNETIFSFGDMNIENRENFQRSLDSFIGNLEKHLIEWKKVRDLSKKPSIKVIK